MLHESPVLDRMRAQITQWQAAADRRAVFLDCYARMTRNTLSALERGDFHDADWVGRLVQHFAGYYFAALDAYERDPHGAPAVWQLAHDAARDPLVLPLQHLLLGVNAHINYDLALAMADMLRPEWETLGETERDARRHDFQHVNHVIATTIDEVQADVLDPAMPIMALVDIAMGPVDEMIISSLLTGWRDAVWQHAVRLLSAAEEPTQVIQQIESNAIRLASLIAV